MVFNTIALFGRSKGPDEFWRKRKIFRLSAHFKGRFRNCYSMAVRAVHRSLQFATKGRVAKRERINEIWTTRIDAGCQEHGLNYSTFREGLSRCEIQLDRKSLAELAVWEPFTFKSLVKIAWARGKQDGLRALQNVEKPAGVVTRGLIK